MARPEQYCVIRVVTFIWHHYGCNFYTWLNFIVNLLWITKLSTQRNSHSFRPLWETPSVTGCVFSRLYGQSTMFVFITTCVYLVHQQSFILWYLSELTVQLIIQCGLLFVENYMICPYLCVLFDTIIVIFIYCHFVVA